MTRRQDQPPARPRGRWGGRLFRRYGPVFALAVALLLASSGCAAGGATKPASTQALPDFLRTAPATVRETYLYALANPDTLKYIPCYCGCGSVGHKSVHDCFVKEVRPDGSVDWDQMGYG